MLLLSTTSLSASAQPLQGGTDSTTLQGGTDSTMLQGGTGSTTLQGGTGSTTLQGGTDGTTIHGGTQRDGGPVTILFLVDASLSMKDDLSRDGKDVQKMDELPKKFCNRRFKEFLPMLISRCECLDNLLLQGSSVRQAPCWCLPERAIDERSSARCATFIRPA